MKFTKATKKQSKLRLAVFGPSGSGKTYSSLSIATGLGGKIAVIDTERGTASKYADRFDFDVLNLEKHNIESYCEAIASAKGYDVLVIDSLTHAWQELLDEVEKIAQAQFKGNTWSAWSKGTPKQRSLVNALLSFPGHAIATMRSKTEWQTSTNANGRVQPTRVGLAPEQGKGIEYEFDLLMELTVEHVATFIKDRTGKYQDSIVTKPGADFGKELAGWLLEGEPPLAPIPSPVQTSVPAPKAKKLQQAQAGAFVKSLNIDKVEFQLFKERCEQESASWVDIALQAQLDNVNTIEGLYALLVDNSGLSLPQEATS